MMASPRSAAFERLVIVGAGGFGREVANYARDAGWVTEGFLDDRATGVVGGLPVLGTVEGVTVDTSRVGYTIAVGDATVRRRLAARVLAQGGRLATVIHPTAYVARDATIGFGAVVCPFAMVGTDATLGENVAINTYASVGHDAVVGAHSVFSPYSVVNGNVVLEEEVFLGTHATVIPGRRVGRRSKVGASACVTRDVGPGFLVAGVPARGRAMFALTED